MRRLESRIVRFWGLRSASLGRILLAVLLLWSAVIGVIYTRAAIQGAPLDWTSQALSILSVGRITFEAAPKWVGGVDILLAALLLFLPRARTTIVLALARFVLAFLPLVMLRDELWRAFPSRPSGAGWGIILYMALCAGAFLCAMRERWRVLEPQSEIADLLRETPAQVAARLLRWRRFGLVAGPIVVLVAAAWPFFWPRYLHWFHARQEASVLNVKMVGRLIKKSMPASQILGGRKITTWVYLPPGYDKPGQRFPVVYVMHGMPGEVRDCFVKGEIQDAAEDLILSKKIKPLILVGWDGQGPGGPADVTNYLDRPDYRMESFVTQELIPYIDRTYKTIPDARFRAMDGISAGGYAAPNLLFKYPGLWKIAASHNGFYSPEDDEDNMRDILGPKGPLWDENDPMQTVAKYGPQDDLHVYLDIGQGDDLQSEFLRFAKLIKARGIDCSARIYPGRHTWTYWSQHFYDSLEFENKCFWEKPVSALNPLEPRQPLNPPLNSLANPPLNSQLNPGVNSETNPIVNPSVIPQLNPTMPPVVSRRANRRASRRRHQWVTQGANPQELDINDFSGSGPIGDVFESPTNEPLR